MTGQPLSTFGEFARITGPAFKVGAMLNDAQLRNYPTLARSLRGREMSDVLRGGADVRQNLKHNFTSRTEEYSPFQPGTLSHGTSSAQAVAQWRFRRTPITWNDEYLELNMGADKDAKYRSQQYNSYWEELNQDAWTDQMEYFEEAMWRVPNTTTMENVAGSAMLSIPCFVNEFPTGLPSAAHPGGVWTTIHGVNPVTSPVFVPQRFLYGAGGAGFTANNSANILGSLDRALLSTKFEPPPMHTEHFEPGTPSFASAIFCSLEGRARLMFLYRNSQSHWTNQNEASNDPLYAGVPITYVAALDDAAIYPTGAADALSTELDTTNAANTGGIGYAGPRYFGIQFKYMRTIFHSSRYFEMGPELTDPRQPSEHTKWVRTYGLNFCPSRQRHFILAPAADN